MSFENSEGSISGDKIVEEIHGNEITDKQPDSGIVEIGAKDVIGAIGSLIGGKDKKQEAPPTPQKQETVTIHENSVLGNMIRTSRATRDPNKPKNNG